jgi:hypothetical protein
MIGRSDLEDFLRAGSTIGLSGSPKSTRHGLAVGTPSLDPGS